MAEVDTTKKLTIKLLNEDAAELLNFDREVTVQPRPQGQRYELNGILKLNDAVFPKPGTYQISVLIDGNERASIPIYVEQEETE